MLVEVYRDRRGDWRWRVVASNGRIVASQGEGYRKRSHCLKMASRLFPIFPIEVVVD